MKRLTKFFLLAFTIVTVLLVTAVSASATDLKIGIGVIDASGLRLRSGPSTDSTIISYRRPTAIKSSSWRTTETGISSTTT